VGVSLGIGLLVIVGEAVALGVWVAVDVAEAEAVADGVVVELAMGVAVDAASGFPGTAKPATNPSTSARPAMGRAISRVRATAPI
jgi:hypothetical protein